MGDDFDRVMTWWALAARLLEAQCEDDDDGWELEISGADLLGLTFHRTGGSAACTVVLRDRDQWEADGDVRTAIEKAGRDLPKLAGHASPY